MLPPPRASARARACVLLGKRSCGPQTKPRQRQLPPRLVISILWALSRPARSPSFRAKRGGKRLRLLLSSCTNIGADVKYPHPRRLGRRTPGGPIVRPSRSVHDNDRWQVFQNWLLIVAGLPSALGCAASGQHARVRGRTAGCRQSRSDPAAETRWGTPAAPASCASASSHGGLKSEANLETLSKSPTASALREPLPSLESRLAIAASSSRFALQLRVHISSH